MEAEFETLVEYPDQDGGALVSGAIDISGTTLAVTLVCWRKRSHECGGKLLLISLGFPRQSLLACFHCEWLTFSQNRNAPNSCLAFADVATKPLNWRR